MPLGDAAADLAVASMSLLNMDDMPAVVREVARVLRPGGRFCFSVVHPLNTLADLPEAGYLDTVRYTKTTEVDGHRMSFPDTHRPLGAYTTALEAAGFVIE